MKPEKVREMSADELRNKERELQEQLFRLRFQRSIGQLDNPVKLREIRRDIARVKTVLRQMQGQASVLAFSKLYLLSGIALVSSLPLLLLFRSGKSRGLGPGAH